MDAVLATPLWADIEKRTPTVFLCAGITGLRETELDPKTSRRVNVTNTVAFLARCAEAGCPIILLSSSAVFSGKHMLPDETRTPDPASEYGRQKADAEAALEGLGQAVDSERLSIVRLTKVLPDGRGLVQSWIGELAQGREVEAFDSVVFSPISLRYAIDGLIRIASVKAGGTFHLSGASDFSYWRFATMLADAMGADPGLVRAAHEGARAGVSSDRQPRFCSLGMEQTTRRTGIRGQSAAAVVADLLARGISTSGGVQNENG